MAVRLIRSFWQYRFSPKKCLAAANRRNVAFFRLGSLSALRANQGNLTGTVLDVSGAVVGDAG